MPRGRPTIKNPKTEVLQIRLTPQEKEVMFNVCEEYGFSSVAEMIISLVNTKHENYEKLIEQKKKLQEKVNTMTETEIKRLRGIKDLNLQYEKISDIKVKYDLSWGDIQSIISGKIKSSYYLYL